MSSLEDRRVPVFAIVIHFNFGIQIISGFQNIAGDCST